MGRIAVQITTAKSEIGFWQLLPWVTMNVVVGFGMLVSGLSAKD